MNQVLETIGKIGIVPVIALNEVKDALPLAKALCDGGIPCAEVTFRTDAAEEAIRVMSSKYPEMIIGAGTVLTIQQAERAVAAGAKFIVSPGINPKVVKYCMEKEIPIIPGCATPTNVEQAIECGLEVVKFFPAEAAGGIHMIKAMSAPYHTVKFMPTGGINENNLCDYLDFNKVIACGGSWMVKQDLITAGEFTQITQLCKAAVKHMLGFKVRHIGINEENAEKASHTADLFASMFGFEKKVGNSSIFAGSGIEVMKSPYLGKNGHIAIETNYIDRAIYHLVMQGCKFDYTTKKYDKKGNMVAIYFEGDIGGFAIHLVQK